MTDERYLFVQDIKDKKNVARSAGKKNRTGKGPVRFPSDYLTRKQKEALNGEMVTYSLNEKVDWETFRSWPHDIQQTYVDILREKYSISFPSMADMFSIKYAALWGYFKRNDLTFPKHKGCGRMRTDEWLTFIGERNSDVQEPQPAKKIEEQTTCESRSTDILKHGVLMFEGSPKDICVELERILGDKRRRFDISFYEIVEDFLVNAYCGSEE